MFATLLDRAIRWYVKREGILPAPELPLVVPGTPPTIEEDIESARSGTPTLRTFRSDDLPQLPSNRKDVFRVYGDPGRGKVDPAWERANMVVAKNLPGNWNNGKGRLYVHRLAEPYLREALRRCEFSGCLGEIERLGCFNFRHQRHDPARPLSYHSWGIAVDINSATNDPAYFTGKVPDCWSDAWKRLWPDGLSWAVVRAWESAGWRWGGRWRFRDKRGRVFVDPMHLELVA